MVFESSLPCLILTAHHVMTLTVSDRTDVPQINWRDSTVLFFEVSSPTNRKQMFVPLAKKFPERRFHFIHPGFVARAMDLWFDMKKEVETRRHKKFHDKPMSGFMAILFMMQVCICGNASRHLRPAHLPTSPRRASGSLICLLALGGGSAGV